MGRRELAEHREQLREGKRWLETMLAKTEKLMAMVDSKLASANEAPAAAANAPPPPAPAAAPAPARHDSHNSHNEDWEFEERERQRQKEFQRLEEEAQRDRQEKERRDKERHQQDRRVPPPAVSAQGERDREREQRERERERDRETLHGLYDRDSFRGRALARDGLAARDNLARESLARESLAAARDKADLERREMLMTGGRRVAGVSPPNTNGRPNASSVANERNHATHERPSGAGAGSVGSGAAKASPWEGESGPGLGSVALPRREPVSSRLGRGLWAFDARG